MLYFFIFHSDFNKKKDCYIIYCFFKDLPEIKNVFEEAKIRTKKHNTLIQEKFCKPIQVISVIIDNLFIIY